jgi:hypothetical protein
VTSGTSGEDLARDGMICVDRVQAILFGLIEEEQRRLAGEDH